MAAFVYDGFALEEFEEMLGLLALSNTNLRRGRQGVCEEKGGGVCEECERLREMKKETETETAKRGRGKGE